MISAEYCRLMARYNTWQNASLVTAADGLTNEDRWKDRLCCDVADPRIVPSAGHRCIRVDGPVRNEQRPRAGIEETKPKSASPPAASPAPAVLQAERTTQSALS